MYLSAEMQGTAYPRSACGRVIAFPRRRLMGLGQEGSPTDPGGWYYDPVTDLYYDPATLGKPVTPPQSAAPQAQGESPAGSTLLYRGQWSVFGFGTVLGFVGKVSPAVNSVGLQVTHSEAGNTSILGGFPLVGFADVTITLRDNIGHARLADVTGVIDNAVRNSGGAVSGSQTVVTSSPLTPEVKNVLSASYQDALIKMAEAHARGDAAGEARYAALAATLLKQIEGGGAPSTDFLGWLERNALTLGIFAAALVVVPPILERR